MSFKSFNECRNILKSDDDTTRRIITAALTASRAAYRGQVLESGNVDDRGLLPGDSVEVEWNPGQKKRLGTITDVKMDFQVKVEFPDSESLWVPDNRCRRVKEMFVDGAHKEMNTVDVGATKFMMSTDGSVHSHIVVEAHLFGNQALPTMIVACRGSETEDDWKTDFSASLDANKKGRWEGKVHSGFSGRAATISIEPMIAHIANGGTVLLTGHSLGSAVSEILALTIAFHIAASPNKDELLCLAERVAFVGFACPVIAVEGLVDFLRKSGIPTGIFHHMHMADDAVPLLTNLYAWRNSEAYRTISAVVRSKALQLVGALAAGEAMVLRSLLVQLGGKQVISYLVDKWRTVAPDLCKCYGRWYCLGGTEPKTFYIEENSHRVEVAQNDCNILSNISIEALKRRVQHHSIFVYPDALKDLLLTELPRARSLCVPAYVRSLTEIQFPTIVEYNTVRSEFTATISRFPFIALVDQSKVSVTILKTDRRFVATGSSMRSLASNELELHFAAQGFDMKPGDKVVLCLTSAYCLGQEPETVNSSPLPIELDSKGHQFAEILNRALFLALSNVKAPNFYDGNEALAATLQCQLKRLEAIACERAALDPAAAERVPLAIEKFPMQVQLVQGGFTQVVFINRVKSSDALYNLSMKPESCFLRVDPKPCSGGSCKAEFTAADAETAAALSFNLEWDGKSFSMCDEKSKLLLTVYSHFGKSLWFYPNNPDDRTPTMFSLLDTNNKPVLPGLHGPLTVCSRILTYRYLSRDCNTELQADVKKMLANPCNYLKMLDKTSSEYVRSELSKKCRTDPKRFLTTNLEESLLSVVDTESFGLPLSFPLRDLFTEWKELLETKAAVPPVTRYYFAGLAVLSDLAMTVCHTVSNSLSVSQKNYCDYFMFWKEQPVTSLSREYNLRVLFLCLEIARPKCNHKERFDRLRADFDYGSPKKDFELSDKIVAHNVTLEFLNTLILDLSKYCTDPATGELVEGKFRENLRHDCSPVLAKALFFVFRLVEGAAKLSELCKRVQVAVVFGPEKCGKTTLLEELTGNQFLDKTNNASGNTKEPFLAMSSTSSAALVRCLSCNDMHCTHDTDARYHLFFDLPGNTDQTKRGGEMRALQLLILGVVRALIVVQPISEEGINQQRFELLANISPSTRAIVLLAKPNARFESIKNKLVNDGVDTQFCSAVDNPESLFFSWESKVFVAPKAEIIELQKQCPATATTPSLQPNGATTSDSTARVVVVSKGADLRLSQGSVTVTATKVRAFPPCFGADLKLRLVWPIPSQTSDSIVDKFPQVPEGDVSLDWWLTTFQTIRQMLEQDKEKYEALLRTFDSQLERVATTEDNPYKMLNSINCSLKQDSDEEGLTSEPLQSYGRAQIIWRGTQATARSTANSVLDTLEKICCIKPEAIQLYIPRMSANFRSTFASETEYPDSKWRFESNLDLKERTEYCSGLVTKSKIRNKNGLTVLEQRLAIVEPMSTAASKLDAQLCNAFKQAQYEVILDQHDVRSLMSTSLAFKDCNADLLKCLGLMSVSTR